MQTKTIEATTALSGHRSFKITRGPSQPPSLPPAGSSKLNLTQMLKDFLPITGDKVVDTYRARNLPNVLRGFRRAASARLLGVPTLVGTVRAKIIRASGEEINLGLISTRVVTDTGVGFIVDAFQNLVELENMKFHGFGTGGTAEAASQTALVTELTTQYATDNTRPTGSLTEGASANIFRTIGTLSPDASVAITEHGLFSQAATGGGVMLDRSLFSVINLVSGDSLQVTYDLTLTSGG